MVFLFTSKDRLADSLEAPDFEIRVGTNELDSFNAGIKPPLNHDLHLREEVYDFLDTRPIHRSVGMFVGADTESMYTDILLQLCGLEKRYRRDWYRSGNTQ